ncbi:MAG: ExsB family protein [Candidatus Infernicultor aquiphilus]|uniref:ExsB family protein n=1 Tax=Candidatus Infernicultor aquiphilus TaxID=1805029 RepID=A0A2M7K715_9BACT|nr:phosphoadenosine phosphosulfate reductase family protein [bacterium]PIU24974.1 MAG: ExsB family protein [Candidatus Atribacteria bacterium CG08_land_8_20_14_0_20_33_29]PIW12236.1 MAG: ExsB family protein [Candidatus Atribacteria bacterium CG17_big_fil_post_rev_8_21_14_2_50_34_11]PIX33938.1 MAG: ExsB family protein [Candidatus Atribacteria bacterium CG_4_8_14_3_um_filter_34_18]PIY31239.1 MAG: ExsB family protein [Candidatus Atribacteria bacterium CG_4_10_14_3_um_filter_34_13]PJB56859.1 MAG: 
MISIKEKISNRLEEIKKISRGEEIVVSFSGGLDSTVVSALALQALGEERVEAITVSFGEYSYSKGLKNIQDISKNLDLKLRIVQGKEEQEKVLKKGPACNKCTRIAKLGRVKREAKGRLVLTGSNQSDTWGRKGLKLYDGFYAPLLKMTKEEIKGIANYFNLKILRIGESNFREGCKLKHLLKPLANSYYHGHTVAEANEILLNILEQEKYKAHLANVKIIGPLNKNIGLINVFPLPKEKLKIRIIKELERLKNLEKIKFLDQPIKLIIKANKGQFDNQHSRYWLEKGRLQPDFSVPIKVDWLLTTNKNLATFQVIDYQIME